MSNPVVYRRRRSGQRWRSWALSVKSAALAAGLCVALAASASAVTITWDYDGSYDPASLTPPVGQSTWTVVTTGGLAIVPNSPEPGVASFPDNLTTGRIQMSNLLSTVVDPAVLGYWPDMSLAEWEYSIRMAVTSPGYPRTFFGVRDEGTTTGRNVMFSHASTGVNLFYVVDGGGAVMGTNLYTADETHPTLGDGQMHDYRIVRRNDAGTAIVDFHLDGTLVDTRPYDAFKVASTVTNGVGIYTSTTAMSDYVVDSVHFSMTVPGKVIPTVERQVSQAFHYDGTYVPSSPTPPTGQSTWKVFTNGALTPEGVIQPNTPTEGVATFSESDAAARFSMNNAFTSAAFIVNPQNYEWEYRFDMAFNSLAGGRPALFGVRDEGGSGRIIMFGQTDAGDLFYSDSGGYTPPFEKFLYEAYVDGNPLNDGLAHSYRVVKDVKPGEGIDVSFYLDEVLIDTRDYFSFEPDDIVRFPAADHGFGVWSSTPGSCNYVIDNISFGPVGGVMPRVPGDANEDGTVDDTDASILAAHWQKTGGAVWEEGDFNEDGNVNDLDASILAANWQNGVGGGAAVPEPGSLVLILSVLALVLFLQVRKEAR